MGYRENIIEMKMWWTAEIGEHGAKTQQGKLSRINFFKTFLFGA